MRSVRPAMLPVFCGLLQMLYCFICLSKREVRDSGKRFVERQRAKGTIHGDSQMDFIDELFYTDSVPSLFLANVQKRSRKTFILLLY